MPLGKKIRPSSAAGKLEIQNVSRILDELRIGEERKTKTLEPEQHGERLPPGVAGLYLGGSLEDRYPPEWLERELLRQENRRHSLNVGDQAILKKCLLPSNNPTRSLNKLKDDFCTYMQLENTKKESVWRDKQVMFSLPATVRPLCHGEPILRIHSTPDGTIVTIREDGSVYYWSPELSLKQNKTVFHERPVNRKPKWATDFITMPQYNKLIIGTGDREIQLYELSSLEPYCQINALETVPLTLDYW
ncbi:uncharacterized protein LOC109615702 [Esox lucius]|uniref:uncharacterized protein LOC109615702 n=1 Tax=Esox lucius TaxID=8010 RepID=UPI00147682AB|nr:uncharacterized protein LOC109615702 [Esox lucius]